MLAIALALLLQVGPPMPQPAPVQVIQNNVTLEAPPVDPEVVADTSVQSFQAIVVQLIAPTLAKWANDALDTPVDFIRRTPPEWTYDNPAVKALANLIKNNALALVALILVVWGLAKILGQEPTIGKPLYGVTLCLANLTIWQIGIQLNNALCDGIHAPALSALVRPHLQLPALTTNPIEVFGPALLVIVYAVVAILLTISQAFRLAGIDVLIVAGSIALLCKASEYSDGWGQRYQQLSAGMLFSQVLVVACLTLAPVLGGIGTGFVGMILGISALLLARRMPALLTSSPNIERGGAGGLFRMLFLRRLFLR